MTAEECETIQLRMHGPAAEPALVYLPGMHGDWTLVSRFREALGGRVRLVEITYPRTTTWSLEEYAETMWNALEGHGLSQVWLLGESFGSRVAWAMLAASHGRSDRPIEGIILAGGFVRHPMITGVKLLRKWNRRVTLSRLSWLCSFYARYARWRHGFSEEHWAGIQEFLRRRADEADRQAILHRYDLIIESDFRALARQSRVPVYYLAGGVDPIVPWVFVWPWLKRHCAGYRAGRVFWGADHAILSGAATRAADCVLGWMTDEGPRTGQRTALAKEPARL